MRRTVVLTAAVLLVVALGAAACASDEDDAAPTTDAPTTSEVTSTVADPRESEVAKLMTERLATEFGDPAIAEQVMANLDPTILTRFEQVAPPEEIATAPILSYQVEPFPGEVDSLVVYSFGNRVAADGTVSAGPTNEALADAVAAYVAQNPVPVYAQWEVAELLTARGVPGVVSIGKEQAQQDYLSTMAVAEQVTEQAEADGVELGTVGVVAHADHLVRAIMATEAAGAGSVVAVEGITLPTTYDPESGQAWTRDRLTYLTVDLSGRLAPL